MKSIREHRHTFLTLLFLVGVLLIAGSFEANLPRPVAAATTPGSQSVQKNASWNFNYGQPDDYNSAAMTQVTYTGEMRDKSTGALITSSATLKPGDQITLDIFANSSYFVTGAWTDSPPAPWVGPGLGEVEAAVVPSPTVTHLLPSPWVYTSTMTNVHTISSYSTPSLPAPEAYAYEYPNFPYAPFFPTIPSNYCPPAHLFNISPYIRAFCMQTSVKRPSVSLSESGMNCGSLSESDTSEGQIKYSTTCHVTTSGPQAQLTANIGATSFYYPLRVRELGGPVGGIAASGYGGVVDAAYNSPPPPNCNARSFYDNESGTTKIVSCDPNDMSDVNSPNNCNRSCQFTENGPQNCTAQCSLPGVTGHYKYVKSDSSIGNFYAPGNIDAAVLSWNIDVAPNPPPAPTLTFTGNPTIIAQSQSFTLNWDSKNTTSCSAPDLATAEMAYWTGPKPTSGSQNVSPLNAGTYTHNLSCTGPGGSVSASVTITVLPPLCSSGVCTILQPPGDTCNSNFQCQSGICQSGTCVSPPGGQCSSNFQCQSGICQSGTCVSGPGGSCSQSSQCQSGLICSGGTCVNPPTCSSGQTTPHSECSGASCVSVPSCGVSSCSSSAQCAPAPDYSLTNTGNIAATIIGSASATSTNSTIKVTPLNGFNSAVNLSVLSSSPLLPSGTQHIFSDSTLTSAEYSTGSGYHVIISGSTTPGTYLITIQGNSGGAIRTTTLTLKVNIQNPNFREVFNPLFNPWTTNEIPTLFLPASLLLGF